MKSNSFSKKLLSAFLAILMALSCFTGVMSAYAGDKISADTEETLYDDNLAYNFLGWVEATDVQTLDAFLDFADQMMGDALGGAKGKLDIAGAVINYDLSSINGLFATLDSARQFLKSALVTVFLGGDAKLFNLGGCLKGYTTSGGTGDVMTRQNSSSKELIRGIVNLLYMNGTNYAKNANNNNRVNAGGEVFQHLVNGSFSVGGLEGLIINIVKGMTGLKVTENTVYGIIGGLLGLPKGFEDNLVNNVVVYLLKTMVADDLTKDNVNNKINTSGTTYYFVDENNQRLSIEQWAFDAINNGVFQTLIGVDSEYIFKNEDGSPNFEVNVGDNAYDDIYKAFVPIFEHTLLPLFSTISLDFNFVTEFTKLYYKYVNDTAAASKTEIDASTPEKLASYWTADKINAWIEADYVEIGKYIGAIQTPESTDENRIYQFPGMAVFNEKNEVTGLADGVTAADVKAAMIELFNSLDRNSSEIDASKLFTNLLYSPVAEALGCETGVLNLNLKDYYLSKHNLCNFFDWSVLPQGGSIKANAYGVLIEMLSFVFPSFNNWAPATGTDVKSIASDIVASAGNLIKFVGDSANKAIFADYDVINESNIEQAVLPLVKAILCEIDMTKHIHEDEWAKCKDLEGFLFVALSEYLKYALPQFDYSCLVTTDENGQYNVTINDMLPMARDALAYVMKPSVPIKDKTGAEWDVFEKGGTKNGALVDTTTTVFDMLNYLVCYYASDSNIAQLLNITKYTVYGTTGAEGYESAISVENTIWENIDIVANALFPMFGTWLGVDKINSEEFVMNTLVNGIINIGDVNTSSFGHNQGLQGISTIFYNLIYMFTDSEIMNKPFLNVAYNFVRDIFNVVLGPRDSGDGFGDFIPANTGLQPFTDAIQNRILGGGAVNPSADCAYSSYSSMGLIGILIGRIAENTLSGELYTKGKAGRDIVDTVTPGLTYVLKSVNDIVGFIPQLSDHTFVAPRATFERSAITQAVAGDGIEGQYIAVENRAAGLNRVLFEDGSSDVTQLSRYYIRVTGMECINDSNLSVNFSRRYEKQVDGTIVADSKRSLNVIAPATTAYYAVEGAPETLGTKQFMVTYDIVDKGENFVDPSYTGLTTISSFYMTEDVAWYDQLYNGSRELYSFGGSGDMTEPNRTTYLDGIEATKTSSGFTARPFGWGNGALTVVYPANIILEGGSPETFANIRMRLNNLYTSKIGSCDRTMDGCFMYKHGISVSEKGHEAYKWAVPVFDEAGNVLKLDSTDYYYPAANNGEGAWIQDNSEYGKTDTTPALEYTETRTHVEYTAAQVAETFGSDHIRFENGIAKEVYIDYTVAKGKVTWGSPIKGVYIKVDPIQISKDTRTYFSWLAVESGVQSVEPGAYNFDVCFPNSDADGYANINVTIADTVDRNSTDSIYKEADKFQSQYMASDFEKLTAEDAKRLGMSADDTYFDAIQSAIGTANAAISKPISTTVVANNEKIATDRMQTIATGVSETVVGDLAYKQVTTELGNIGLEYYAVDKNEFGVANGTYYYMDKDGKYPYYTNTPVDATEANFNNSAYVFVNKETGVIVDKFNAEDAAKYEVHYRNTEEYAKEWTFVYDTPYLAETSEKTGKYVAKQFKYAYGDGSEASSKKQWVFKYPEVITTNVPNEGATDYRSEYLKQADLLTYVMEVAKQHVSSAGAARIVNEIIDDRKNLDENNFDMVTYRMMVKTAKYGEALVDSSYDTVFTHVTPSDDDENFEVTGSYDFYVKSGDSMDPEKDRHIAKTTYNLFISNVAKGDYASYGVPSTAVEGNQFYFGKWEVAPEYKNEDGSIKYDWTTTSSGVAINEAIRLYNVYKAEAVHRGYQDNDLAFMKEILCATGDTYVADTYANAGSKDSYDINKLRTYTEGAFSASYSTEKDKEGNDVLAAGTGSVTFANAAATPKYGALENGVLVNNGAVKYTAESWSNYVDALAKAVVAVKNASTSDGYTQGMYDDTANYDHDINSVQNIRTALMTAENQLEEATASASATVTGTIVSMLDPSNPDAVVNGGKGTPVTLAGVTVTVGDQVATTDENGVFTLSLENGTYTAVIHYVNGLDRTVTINVNGADIDAGMITMVPCDYDNNGEVNVRDTRAYNTALSTGDLINGDLNDDGLVNVRDTRIYKQFLSMSKITNIYPEKTIG